MANTGMSLASMYSSNKSIYLLVAVPRKLKYLLVILISYLRACLDATLPFRSLIQIVPFLPFQNGGKAIFTAETFA